MRPTAALRYIFLLLAFIIGNDAAPVATTTTAAATQTALPYFHNLAVANGKLYFGSATDQPGSGEDTDLRYQAILNDTRVFGAITPINSMKGAYVHPQLNVWNFTNSDIAAGIARSNANEVFNDDGTLSASPWYSIIGSDYVELAFKYAYDAVAATGKDIKLYYNDFWIEAPGPRIDAIYSMIQSIKSKYNFTIAVGLESHFKVNDIYIKANQTIVMSNLQKLNATFAVTELDVKFPSLPPNGSYTYQAQALRYWETVSACMSFRNCEGISVWDFLDTYSWVPSSFPGAGQADLLNANFTQKLAVQAVVDALQGKACSVC